MLQKRRADADAEAEAEAEASCRVEFLEPVNAIVRLAAIGNRQDFSCHQVVIKFGAVDIVAIITCSKHFPHFAAMLRAVVARELRQLDHHALGLDYLGILPLGFPDYHLV